MIARENRPHPRSGARRHAYGGVKQIQPITETIETVLWLVFVALFYLFFPASSAG